MGEWVWVGEWVCGACQAMPQAMHAPGDKELQLARLLPLTHRLEVRRVVVSVRAIVRVLDRPLGRHHGAREAGVEGEAVQALLVEDLHLAWAAHGAAESATLAAACSGTRKRWRSAQRP